ncbi:MAG: fatty acid desaturase [Spirochaetia bacterium]|nr:fatty acid desaturase [Spirochaetia bacterium]
MNTFSTQFNAFEADMKKLKQDLRKLGYLERPVGFIIFSWVYNLTFAIIPAIIFFYNENFIVKVLCVFLAGLGCVGIATCSHNASHGNSFKTKLVNQFMDIFGFDFIIGISSRFWDNFHNKLHHPNTSIVSIDPDTDILPWFALHEKQVENAGSITKIYYKYQWIFFPFLVGFYVIMLQVMGWKFLLKKLIHFNILDHKQRLLHILDVIVLAAHYVFWIALPYSFNFSITEILILYIGKNFISGMLCFFALAPTHYVRDALYFDEEILKLSYYSRQMFSTINFRVGFFGTPLLNGVEHHLDHHLFPQVSPSLCKRLGNDIKKIAQKHGMPYRSLSWLEIIIDSYRVIMKPKVVDNSLIEKYITKLS